MTDRHSPASSRLAIAVLLVGAGGPAAAGQCVYDVEVIEGPSCGVFSIPMIAEGINAAGRICGHVMACDLETQFAMHQRPGGSLEVLEFGGEDFRRPYAMAIADSGTIVGELEFDEPIDGVIRTAFVHDGDEFHLFDVPEGGNFARAEAVTADGSRVAGLWGNFVTGDPAGRAFCLIDGAFIDVAAMLDDPSYSLAYAIDRDSGRIVVGTLVRTASSPWSAFLVDLETGESRTLAAPDATRAEARSTAGGWTAGSAQLDLDGSGMIWRGIRWHPDGRPERLEPSSAGAASRASAVTPAGTVVGWSTSDELGNRATIWHRGRAEALDLNDLVPADTEVLLGRAGAIAGGTIVCAGNLGGHAVAVRLTPVDPPASDLTDDCRVDAEDLGVLLAAWGSNHAFADLDGDGIVGVADLLSILRDWSG